MVPPILVRRLKSHFLTLPCGVDLILGLNGYIWISKHVKENEQGEEGFDAEAVYSNVNDVCGVNSLTICQLTTMDIRKLTCRLEAPFHELQTLSKSSRPISYPSQIQFCWRHMSGQWNKMAEQSPCCKKILGTHWCHF